MRENVLNIYDSMIVESCFQELKDFLTRCAQPLFQLEVNRQ